MSAERPVPESRLGRLSLIGRLAGGVAGGMLSAGARQLSQGQKPSVGDLVFTPTNLRRMGDRLSEMRGAAMKVGQLLSMDSGHLLPPQFGEVLARLREDAHRMPLGQVAQVLNGAWGKGWESRFERFAFTPMAAASIGQVHEARLRDGGWLAVKVQYPGVRRSIDSDVDNVAALLRLFNLLPGDLAFQPLLEEAKRQLHEEADYTREAASLDRFRRLVADDDRFQVPDTLDTLTTPEVLVMTYMDGVPIETVRDLDPGERDRVAGALLQLALREVFEWGLVQTDPNFANYLYQPSSGRIQLLDFGASRSYPPERRAALGRLLGACLGGGEADVLEHAGEVGYLGEDDPPAYRAFVVDLLRLAVEPLAGGGVYAFAGNDLARRMSERLVDMRLRSRVGRLPPPDILFLHRKLGGLYLLLTRLGAKLPVRAVADPFLDAAA